MSENLNADNGIVMVFCTFPEMGTARDISFAIMSKGLAVCVNLIPGIESIYLWEGKMQAKIEVQAVYKARAESFASLESALSKMHPYAIPEIVGVATDKVSAGYLDWVRG